MFIFVLFIGNNVFQKEEPCLKNHMLFFIVAALPKLAF